MGKLFIFYVFVFRFIKWEGNGICFIEFCEFKWNNKCNVFGIVFGISKFVIIVVVNNNCGCF